jgi:hypothetical protein
LASVRGKQNRNPERLRALEDGIEVRIIEVSITDPTAQSPKASVWTQCSGSNAASSGIDIGSVASAWKQSGHRKVIAATASLARRATLLIQAGRSLVLTPYANQLAVTRARAHPRGASSTYAGPGSDGSGFAGADVHDPRQRRMRGAVRRSVGRFDHRRGAPRLPALRPKPNKEATSLSDGRVELEIGTACVSASKMRSQIIFRDRFIGAVRLRHPLLENLVTPQRYAACGQVVTSRRGASAGPVDEALHELGLRREIVAIVPGFLINALALVPRSSIREGEITSKPGCRRIRHARGNARPGDQRDGAPASLCPPGPSLAAPAGRAIRCADVHWCAGILTRAGISPKNAVASMSRHIGFLDGPWRDDFRQPLAGEIACNRAGDRHTTLLPVLFQIVL